MDIAGTDYNVFQYMFNHENSWIPEESIMASSSLLLSAYLTSQENVVEVIKIEEMSPISSNDPCVSGATEDVKYVHTSCREGYIHCESEICSTQFPSETHPMLLERLHKTEKA